MNKEMSTDQKSVQVKQQSLSAPFSIPRRRNENFIGRESLLKELIEQIHPNTNKKFPRLNIIRGLEGIGKTEIALEAAYRVHNEDPDCGILWVAADDIKTPNILSHEGSSSKHDQPKYRIEDQVKNVLGGKTVDRWLLIIENPDELRLSDSWLPRLYSYLQGDLSLSRKGSILLTCCDDRLDMGYTILEVPRMSDIEAKELIRAGLKTSQIDDEKKVEDLLELLDYTPLAIKQASAYMSSNTNVTISQYFDIYNLCKLRGQALISPASSSSEDDIISHRFCTHMSVAVTWLISFEYISRHHLNTSEYLKSACVLAESDIPLSLLPNSSDGETNETINTLKSLAFTKEQNNPYSLKIHRCVHQFTRGWLQEQGELQRWVEIVVERLSHVFPSPQPSNMKVWTSYLPHASVVLELREKPSDKGDKLLSKVAESYNILGDFEEAERLYRELLELRQRILGEDNPETLNAMQKLINVLESQRENKKFFLDPQEDKEAKELCWKLLQLKQQSLGKRHPGTLGTMHDLSRLLQRGIIYDTLRGGEEYSEKAERMCRETLQLSKEILGEEHLDTLSATQILARALQSREKYEEAVQIYREALHLSKILERKDFELSILDNLERIFYIIGDQTEARKVHDMCIEAQKRTAQALERNHRDSFDGGNILLDDTAEAKKPSPMDPSGPLVVRDDGSQGSEVVLDHHDDSPAIQQPLDSLDSRPPAFNSSEDLHETIGETPNPPYDKSSGDSSGIVSELEESEDKISFWELLAIPQTLPEMVDRIFDLLHIPSIEEPVPQGMTRLRYQCECGAMLYHDTSRRGSGSPNQVSSGAGAPSLLPTTEINGPPATAPLGFGPYASLLRLVKYITASPRGLPRGNRPRSTQSTDGSSSMHLLLFIDKGQELHSLHRVGIENELGNKELFKLLRRKYYQYRSYHSWFTLRYVRKLYIANFKIYPYDLAELRKKEGTCVSSSCVCFPPLVRAGLQPEKDYCCEPAPEQESDDHPIISPKILTHFFKIQHVFEQGQSGGNTEIYNQLPKKRGKPDSKQVGKDEWGIYFEEGWHWRTIYFLVFLTLSGSLTFGVVWAVVKGSLGDGFTTAGFGPAIGAIVIALLAWRSTPY
ncbi:hypothetical protein F4805DRAFT_417324 [Annulohypoxylon moriforme]|nr:hypothetical protein F4805DRAFT_417324 [Annulohypoxylon moriforme]